MNKTTLGVTPEQIAKYLTLKTGKVYGVIKGSQSGFGSPNYCIMVAPVSLGIVKAQAGVNENGECTFVALNKNGENVYNENEIVFLWSFDMCFDKQNGVNYVSSEGIKNGVLCMNMLGEKYGYSDKVVAELQAM